MMMGMAMMIMMVIPDDNAGFLNIQGPVAKCHLLWSQANFQVTFTSKWP
jgi:hypothetical protein